MISRHPKRNSWRRLCVLVCAAAAASSAARNSAALAQTPPSYVQLARAYLAAPTVAAVLVRDQSRPPKSLRLAETPGPASQARLVITADTQRVFKAPDPLTARFSYLWTGATTLQGKPPVFKKQALVVFLRPFTPLAADRAAQGLTLEIGPRDIQLPATPDMLAQLAVIGAQAAAADIPAMTLTGSVQASTTEADAPYARFTQFLLPAKAGNVLALTVRSRSDGSADVVQAQSDVLGTGTPVAPNTLLWYHLVCQLPAALPLAALEQASDAAERTVLAADYQTVRAKLGSCQ